MARGDKRARGGLRVLASTAPSMVRALQDAAVDIFTTETEAIPLGDDDDEAADAQRPMPAVTGRRSVAFRQSRVKAQTNPNGAEGSSEVVGFPLSFGAAPPAAEVARVVTGRAEPPVVASPPSPDSEPALAVAPRSPLAGSPRRWLLAAVVGVGVAIGVVVALAGPGDPPGAPPTGSTLPSLAVPPERGPQAAPPVGTDAPRTGQVEAPGTPMASADEAVAAPVDEAVAAPADEAVAAPVDEAVAAPADEAVAAPVDEVVAAPVDEVVAAPVDEAVAAPSGEVVAAPVEDGSAAVVDGAPAVSPRIERIQRQRQKAYQREFEQRKRERLKVLAEQARENRALAAERKRQYKADFERRKRERLEATTGQ